MRRLESRDLALHLARVGLTSVALAASPSPAIAAAASLALFFATFALAHDLTHGALGLSRRTNEIALAAAGLLLFTSGHAIRAMHRRHHARPFDERDLEGRGARLSALGALLAGPPNMLALRCEAWRVARGTERAWQRGESIASAALAALALVAAPETLGVYLAMTLALHATASLWASHVPHHAPPSLVAFAARLSFTRSPIFLSLAYHELHHAHPRVPCQQLAIHHARRAGPRW